jgi:hypothetical protein
MAVVGGENSDLNKKKNGEANAKMGTDILQACPRL